MKKGSALIIAILLMAVIATASFGVARLVLIELDSGGVQTANIKAYYLAEAGIEEGLLRWRYDHKAELLTGSRGATTDTKKWQLADFTNSTDSNLSTFKSTNFATLLPSDDYLALTMYNRVQDTRQGTILQGKTQTKMMGEFGSDSFRSDLAEYIGVRPDLYVKKDNKIIFGLGGAGQADDIQLIWRFDQVGMTRTTDHWPPIKVLGVDEKVGIEVRLFKKTGTSTTQIAKKVYSPDGSSYHIDGANNPNLTCNIRACFIDSLKADLSSFAVTDDTYVTITPIGADIIVAAWGRTGSVISGDIVDSVSHIESVGVSGGRMKGLEAKIDQNSGRILGLFDFVLFQGGR